MVFVWIGGLGDVIDEIIFIEFISWKVWGIDGLFYNGGYDFVIYVRVGKIVK